MEALGNLGVLLSSAWASGFNLYLTVAGLGLADRMGWVSLPGQLDILSHPLVIGAACLMFCVEFLADKIPYVDSAWDSVHTFIRPLGGAALAYLGTSGMGPAVQTSLSLLGGAVAMESHLTKATTRVAINTSPEPMTNTVASVTEDATVVGILWLIIKHPIIALLVAIGLIVLSVWILKRLFGFVKQVFRFLSGKEEKPKTT